MKNAYPIVMTQGKEFIVVFIPDFNINTQGKDVPDAIEMARDAIGLMGIDMREEADEGNLVCSFGALDAERNYYQNAGSDRRQRRGGAEQVRTTLREEVFTDIQKHYV